MTDHKAKSELLLEQIATRWGQIDSMLAEAQVHATLALAEQQRIANVIALASLRVAPNDVLALRHLVMEPKDEYGLQPTAAIREGLGL